MASRSGFRSLAVFQRSRTAFQRPRSARPGFVPPTAPVPGRRHRTLTGRAGRYVVQLRRGRPVRGGFFKDLVKGVGKVVGTVTKLPVVGTIAKAAISSLPVVGQVVTAVSAVKRLTAASASAGVAGGVMQATAGGAPLFTSSTTVGGPRRRRRATRKRTRTTKRAKRTKRRSKGGTAKQRAARARFARAAKRGRIRKGSRLR